ARHGAAVLGHARRHYRREHADNPGCAPRPGGLGDGADRPEPGAKTRVSYGSLPDGRRGRRGLRLSLADRPSIQHVGDGPGGLSLWRLLASWAAVVALGGRARCSTNTVLLATSVSLGVEVGNFSGLFALIGMAGRARRWAASGLNNLGEVKWQSRGEDGLRR